MELQEAILKRRSIRKFTDYYVTDDEIKKLLEAARWAPSWANTQTWTFIIARDKDVIKGIASTFSKNNPAKEYSLKATVLIAACAKKGIAGCRDGHELTKLHNWFMFDLGLAVQNLCLKAYELGLGTVIVGMLDHEECKKLLSVPYDYDVVTIIPVGHPDEHREGPKRKTLDTMAYINKFGEPFIK
jgi:nitroreductase